MARQRPRRRRRPPGRHRRAAEAGRGHLIGRQRAGPVRAGPGPAPVTAGIAAWTWTPARQASRPAPVNPCSPGVPRGLHLTGPAARAALRRRRPASAAQLPWQKPADGSETMAMAQIRWHRTFTWTGHLVLFLILTAHFAILVTWSVPRASHPCTT